MKQHKWHKEIKAWADGAEIEVRRVDASNTDWHDWKDIGKHYIHGYLWDEDNEYRIKPQPKEPQYLYAWSTEIGMAITSYKEDIPSQYKYIGKIKLEADDDTSGT